MWLQFVLGNMSMQWGILTLVILYNNDLPLRLCLVRVKVFPENIYFSEMLFSRKENIFMCLVAFQKMFRKIFSDVWLYSWKYHRKHIFYLLTCSHISSVTKRIHNIIHSSKHKQNPEKKSSNPKKRRRDRDLDWRDRDWRDHDRSFARSRSTPIGAVSRSVSLSLAAFVRWVCFVVFWLSVFLSLTRATEIVWR